jgi:hypothetical protein
MKWFNNDKQKRIEMIQTIRPTSKATLKIQCLIIAKDVDEATKLYDYFAKDMPELPDYDPVQPTWMDNTKQTASSLMAWLGENKDTLAQAYEFVRNVIQNRSLPPIAPEAPAATEALTPIN